MDEEIDEPPSLLPYSSCLGNHRNPPSPDVSRLLPAELLASVFIHIARDSYTDEKYVCSTPTRPSWFNVSYVCRYWRDVALNCPTLWSYIPATSQRWTEELLVRSRIAPLKISTKTTSMLHDFFHPDQELKPAEVLSIVEQVMNHSQRIQQLRIDVGFVSQEHGYQILSKFLFTHLPCLQHLEISHFHLPEAKSWLLEENTPALWTLKLQSCSIRWHSLGPSVLTTLHLSDVGIFIHENTMAEFLAVLRRMPHLVQLSVENSLPSAHDFLSNGNFDATPKFSLPRLSNMSVTMAPLSAVTALVSCVDIPLRTKIQLEVYLESTSEDISTLDDYVRLASLLGQRISQPDSPKFRSLTIGSPGRIALAFSTLERVECYSRDSLFSIRLDDDALLKIVFVSDGAPMDALDYPALSGICSQIPLTNIQSVHFLGSSLEPEFWRDILSSLSDVRHIRFSQNKMPNITSMLSLPSHHLTRSWQDDRADRGRGEIFVPALEELELYQTTLKRVRGRSDPNPYVADVQALYDAIATRKETRCRLTIRECRSMPEGRVVEALDSVGWWESTEFRVTSNVRYGCGGW